MLLDSRGPASHDTVLLRQTPSQRIRIVTETDIDPVFARSLQAACQRWDIVLAPSRIEILWRHFSRVREANKQFNLTRIIDARRAAIEHYADSLTLLPWLARHNVLLSAGSQALDVGTGGGWPGLPLAVCLPDVQWTAIDSTGKKARFVAETAAVLEIRNLCALHARARELVGRAGPFDLMVCRAVAKLAKLVRETADLLAPGGRLVCYKTARMTDEERADGQRAATQTRLIPQSDTTISLGDELGDYSRVLVSYRREPVASA